MLYADTSALIRAYLPDEPGHRALRSRLREGSEGVLTSELAIIELASAVRRARRGRRIRQAEAVLARIDRKSVV